MDMTLRITREDFLKDEVLFGVLVSSQKKAILKHQLDMLEIVQDICARHRLRYLLCGGSLLGAVRHKGYIPWDDDIDISMLRPDYDKFIDVATKELKAPYFLQTSLTEPNRYIRYAKLRNSATTAISEELKDEERDSNQGIFIDIFPVDGVPDHLWLYRFEMTMMYFFTSIDAYAHMRRDPGGLRRFKKVIYRFLYHLLGNKRVYELRECVLRRHSVDKCKLSGQISFFGLNDCTNVPSEWFKDAIEVPFEYLYARIPRNYDAILSKQYGDWHKMVKGTQYHNGMLFDSNRSYVEVLAEGK